MIRLRALFGLLDNAGSTVRRRKHWAGPLGLPGAKRAAEAAAGVLQGPGSAQLPVAAAAAALTHLGLWWAAVGGNLSLAAATLVQARAAAARADGLVPPVGFHLGVVLAQNVDCSEAIPLLEEAAEIHGAGRCILSAEQLRSMESAFRRCRSGSSALPLIVQE